MSFENPVVLQSNHDECEEDGESMGADGLHIDDQVDLLSLDNLLEDMDQVLIAEFFHTWRLYLYSLFINSFLTLNSRRLVFISEMKYKI